MTVPRMKSGRISRRAAAAVEKAAMDYRPNQFPGGPTYSVELQLTWDPKFFAQFTDYLIPWMWGVYGYNHGWLDISPLFYSGPTFNNVQPIIQHSKQIEFPSGVTSFGVVADVITPSPGFAAQDINQVIYWVDHEPVVQIKSVQGGGVLPVELSFQHWTAQTQT